MTALEIIRDLKRNRSNVLWVNDERREAAHLCNVQNVSVGVAYNDAITAKGDPSIGITETRDGTVYAAI
jgi:hypothetical protein